MLYPQNGDRIVTIDSVTSIHPMYKIENTGGTWTNTNSYRENEALSNTFTCNILRHNCFMPTFKSWTVHRIIEYLTLELLSSLWNIHHSTTVYFFDPPCIYRAYGLANGYEFTSRNLKFRLLEMHAFFLLLTQQIQARSADVRGKRRNDGREGEGPTPPPNILA